MAFVLHIITGLETGGAETALCRLIAGFAPGWRHKVVSLTRGGAMLPVFLDAGIDVVQLDFRKRPVAGFIELVRLIRASRPDIVQTWMYHADLAGGLAARLAGNRRVIWGIRTTRIGGGSRATAMVARVCAWLSRSLPHTIVCVAAAARRAHAAGGYDPARMRVIHNGFEPTLSPAAAIARRAALRSACGFDDSQVVVGSLGRFDSDKDLQNFIRAAGMLAARHGCLRVLMIGYRSEAELAWLTAWIGATGHAGRFVLMRERTDAMACLPAMDLFCLSSRNEGFPNVVGEAMACALPCVVTDVGDAAILVGDAGVVVPREDAAALAAGIESVLMLTTDERMELGRRALARIGECYTVRHAQERFESLYRQVMTGGD